jgi:hypothetical protein
MPGFSPLHAGVRMLRSSHRDLLRWAAELWPGLVPDDAPRADVRAERAGAGWTVVVARDGIAGLEAATASASRASEAAFFLMAFERRAAALERLVLALLARHQVALEHGQPLEPVPHALVAGDLLRTGQGAESGSTPEARARG